MAITWNWNEKCGEATFSENIDGKEKTFTTDLYVGNCFLIMLHEFKEDGKDKYALDCFFVDEEHMRRCLEKDNIFDRWYGKLIKISINKAKCRNYKKIVALLAEYMDDIQIEVYKDGEYTWKEYKAPDPVISDMRMREIAEKAVSALHENGGDWKMELEDADLDLTPEEMDYFGIEIYDEDDEEDWS